MGGRLDIAIVGAGPAGLAAALLLHRAGNRVTILERFAAAKPLGSGLILQPTGLTVLAALGLYDEILELGSRIDRLHGADARTGRTVLDVRYDAVSGGRFGLAVHRAALFDVLHRAVAAEGIPIETRVEIEALETGSRATPVGTDGRRLGAFDLVVDASGARSRLRRFSGDASEPRPLAYGAFWASLGWRGEGFDQHALLQRYDRASVMIGVLPIGRPDAASGPMAAFFWSIKPDEADAVRGAGLDAWKAEVRALWPDTAGLLETLTDPDQLTLARYGHHTLARPVADRLAIIGDAAHSTSPQLGQGVNMGLLDAWGLAQALTVHADLPDALSAYAAARRWHVRLYQALSFGFTPFYQADGRFLPWIRDHVLGKAARLPLSPRLLAATVSGLLLDPRPRDRR